MAATARGSAGVERTAKDKRSLDYAMKTGLAGGLAACAAKTTIAPLDRVKILLQAASPQFAKYTGSWGGMFRVLQQINQQEGFQGLFRGHSVTLLRIFPYGGIKFLAYEQVRAIIITRKEHETALRRFISGSLAGVFSVFLTYPLEVIRVRMAFETKRESRSTLASICNKIYHERPRVTTATAPAAVRSGNAAAAATLNSTVQTVTAVTPRSGIRNFYRGFSPTLVGMLPYAGMSFLTHDTIGDWLRHPVLAPYTTTTRRDGKVQLKNTAELVSGALAGLVSQTCSYPLEVVRRRMQVGGAVGDGHRLRMGETARLILSERGWRGFFVGLGIGYIKVMPMVAVSFWTYEKTKEMLGV